MGGCRGKYHGEADGGVLLRQLAGDNYSRHFLDLVQIRRILLKLEILSLGASLSAIFCFLFVIGLRNGTHFRILVGLLRH